MCSRTCCRRANLSSLAGGRSSVWSGRLTQLRSPSCPLLSRRYASRFPYRIVAGVLDAKLGLVVFHVIQSSLFYFCLAANTLIIIIPLRCFLSPTFPRNGARD